MNPEIVRKNIEETRRGVRIRFYVKPNSNRTALVVEEDELVFYTDEPPVAGRANASLIRFLSRSLGVSSSRVRIVRGTKDRVKIVEVEDVKPDLVVDRLSSAAEPW